MLYAATACVALAGQTPFINAMAQKAPGELPVPRLGTGAADAADEQVPGRRKVALVMGGGGTSAAAHIGVLKELERQRVPVDLVVGSGLGGVVGGLYAAGFTAAEVETIILTADWEEILSGGTRREDLSFRRKQDDDGFLVRYQVGIRDGRAQAPTALVPADKIAWFLEQQTVRVQGRRSFDELPTAFRTVAVDLVTGDEVVLDSGSLDQAMLVSITAAGILPPVQTDQGLLISGSVTNNLPADVAREWGADVIIVSNVPVHLRDGEDINSIFAVTEQLAHILQQRDNRQVVASLGPADVLIESDAPPASETDYSEIEVAIAAGQRATLDAKPRLVGLSIAAEEFTRIGQARARKTAKDPVIATIVIENDSPVADELIRSYIQQPLNAPLDRAQLNQDLRTIFGLASFATVDFELVDDASGTTLVVSTIADPAGQKFWRFGLNLEDDLDGNSAYTASASFTWTQANRLGAEWRSVFRIGEQIQATTEWFQPLSFRGKWFVAPDGGYLERNVNLFDNGEIVSQFRVFQLAGGVAAGRFISNKGQATVGVFRGIGETRVNIGPADIPDQEFDRGGLSAALRLDTFDNISFPTRGTRGFLRWVGTRKSLGSDREIDILSGVISHATSWGPNTLLFGAKADYTLEGDSALQDLFPIGGFLNLSGFRQDELFGKYAGVVRAVGYRNFGANPLRGLLDATFYAGASLELGNAWCRDVTDLACDESEISLKNSLWAGSLFLGLDTFIGPVYLAGGYAEGGNKALYLFVGNPL